MAKTYIDAVKYVVYANVLIDGLVEKPDVVGAIFGQTEGLLGDELDLRDLQKNGRIGRIEVDLTAKEGKTTGVIKIPSSLDMVETCIIAAALETVDRIGPCEANLKITRIEDTRNVKRKMLVEKAKGLLKRLLSTEIPESKEISELVREEVKKAEVVEYGPERLAAGPNIDRATDIILVEGRADVINLLKNDVTNVIEIGGAKVPQTIIDISKKKEVTVFLDGDRGGDIILNELIQGGVEIDYIARAPTGKEVEELTRKEMIKYIRNRVPFEQSADERFERKKMKTKRVKFEKESEPERYEKKDELEHHAPAVEPQKRMINDEALMNELNELANTLKARFYDSSFTKIKEVEVRDVIKALEEVKGVESIVFDGIITQRLVDLAANKGVKTLVGVKLGNVSKTPEGIKIQTKTQ